MRLPTYLVTGTDMALWRMSGGCGGALCVALYSGSNCYTYYMMSQFFTGPNKLLPLFTNIRPILTNQIHTLQILHLLRFQFCKHHVELSVQKHVGIVVVVYWPTFLNLDIYQNNRQNSKVEDVDN